jgi:hypothetical protein
MTDNYAGYKAKKGFLSKYIYSLRVYRPTTTHKTPDRWLELPHGAILKRITLSIFIRAGGSRHSVYGTSNPLRLPCANVL